MSSIKQKHLNVAYANDSDKQKMDIFIPEAEGLFPAVVLIHGGGFKAGDKKMEYFKAKKLVENGYVAVSVNYRLSGEAVFPAAVHDVKAAIRFIKANADKYAINPNKIGTWGVSAGGNLSAMMGTSAGNDFADGIVGNFMNESTRIQACIDWFGPINFATMTLHAKQLRFKKSFDVTIESKYIGADAADPANNSLVQSANPATYIDENDPPFYIQVGDKDPLVPFLQSQEFANELLEVLGKKRVKFDILESAGHGGSHFNREENLNKVIAFLDEHLKT
ncbi:MAG: alpha/beta hydrolase [Bacteroidota bacterium]